jgi:hypothetical protein
MFKCPIKTSPYVNSTYKGRSRIRIRNSWERILESGSVPESHRSWTLVFLLLKHFKTYWYSISEFSEMFLVLLLKDLPNLLSLADNWLFEFLTYTWRLLCYLCTTGITVPVPVPVLFDFACATLPSALYWYRAELAERQVKQVSSVQLANQCVPVTLFL